MEKRALITGVGGFLGSNLALHLKAQGWAVWGSWRHNGAGKLDSVELRRLDVSVPEAIEALVKEAQPSVIFHLAAMAEPDACAEDMPATRQVNVQGAKLVAEAAARTGARLIFTSTDQVFDGSKSFFGETDTPRPLGVYGKSKHDAEALVLEATHGQALVLRLALTYGWGRAGAKGRNFAEKWLRTLLTGGRLTAFKDQFRTPIYVDDAVQAMTLAAEEGWGGLLHLAGPERLSRHDFAVRLAKEFSFPEAAVQAASVNDVVFRDARPPDASLSIAKLQELGFSPRDVDAGLKAMHSALEGL